ncbi:uncharacterized protein RCO7_08741 [Rhynchosporium graminicola]|uniref:Gfd2/YDR514C-like C-terminal domain-containing protein n=1 Tax=Rhynchosporium graminicola TaxID=2792576 RepID=A0A1E1KCF9_9HELO|nr:uncharacterized protein RCO7_08741 [Rhynchosporium commune]
MPSSESTKKHLKLQPEQNDHNPTDSGSESDEYITSGGATRENKDIVYTSLGDGAEDFAQQFATYQLKQGQLTLEGESFIPWAAFKKYPYTYIGNSNRQRVNEEFFDRGKVVNEPWDFFYIYRGPSDLNLQPILLVPTRQVDAFLKRINQKLDTALTVPSGGANGAFQVTFTNDGTPQPRYLGFSINNDMAESLRKNVPPHYFKLDGEPGTVGTPSDRSLAAFRTKISLMTQAQKGKKIVNKEKQKKDRIEKQQAWSHSIKRVQRYLGLRESTTGRITTIRASLGATEYGWAYYEDAVKQALAKLPPSAVFNADEAAPYAQEASVVFVCIDVEAYERNARVITEVGIATLDTNDLKSLAPGEGGFEWMKKIRARHFRIKENMHYSNTEFVAGCADKFEFGQSEIVGLKDAPHMISTCFKPPFSGSGDAAPDENKPKRNIILVGHDVGADVHFLQSIGYDIHNLSNLLEQADTAIMWRYLKRESNPRNLGSILADLGIIGWNLHNAGNDAVYTLQAMIGIAIKQIEEKQKKLETKDLEKKNRISEHVKEAVEMAVEREEGWSSGGENSDGGAPVPIVRQPTPQAKKDVKSQTWQRNQPAASTQASRGPAQSGNSQWGAHSSQLNATTEAFSTMLISNQGPRDRSSPWRLKSASGPAGASKTSGSSAKTAKLESLLKKSSISKGSGHPPAKGDEKNGGGNQGRAW